MLIKKIKEERLIFDNEKEALDRYEEIDNSTDCVENRISKNFSFEFDKWVYTITYKTIKYSEQFITSVLKYGTVSVQVKFGI